MNTLRDRIKRGLEELKDARGTMEEDVEELDKLFAEVKQKQEEIRAARAITASSKQRNQNSANHL